MFYKKLTKWENNKKFKNGNSELHISKESSEERRE